MINDRNYTTTKPVEPVSQRPLTGRAVLVWLLGFFGVIIAVNAVMMKLAIDTLPGTEVDSSYQAGLHYNVDIEAARRQVERRWQVTGHIERDQDGHTVLSIEARNREGAPLSGLTVKARLMRPADGRSDRLVALTEGESGIYRGSVEAVELGQWDMLIEADRDAQQLFRSHNRVMFEAMSK